MGEVEALPDLAVREPVCRQLRDLQLLGGQLVTCLGDATPAALPGGAQLPPRLLAPRHAAECVERVARGAQDGARLGDASLAPEPLAVRELEPRALVRPPRQVARERLGEA